MVVSCQANISWRAHACIHVIGGYPVKAIRSFRSVVGRRHRQNMMASPVIGSR